jgi:hypothetical protein
LTLCELAFNIIPCVLNNLAIFEPNQKNTFGVDVDVENSGGSGEVEHGLVALVCACILVDVNVVVQAALHQQFVFAVGDSFLEEMVFVDGLVEIIGAIILFVIHIGVPIFFEVKQVITFSMDVHNFTRCICERVFQSKLQIQLIIILILSVMTEIGFFWRIVNFIDPILIVSEHNCILIDCACIFSLSDYFRIINVLALRRIIYPSTSTTTCSSNKNILFRTHAPGKSMRNSSFRLLIIFF